MLKSSAPLPRAPRALRGCVKLRDRARQSVSPARRPCARRCSARAPQVQRSGAKQRGRCSWSSAPRRPPDAVSGGTLCYHTCLEAGDARAVAERRCALRASGAA